jgi:beta-glucosidase/6-phospho-beta-glucosidase/beta-galactosidase
VKTWLTFNEPYVSAWIGYGLGAYAPGIYSPDVGVYTAAHHMIKAHATVWHTYDDQFKPTQLGLTAHRLIIVAPAGAIAQGTILKIISFKKAFFRFLAVT